MKATDMNGTEHNQLPTAVGKQLTPREAGQRLAASAPPLTDEQVLEAARIFASGSTDA